MLHDQAVCSVELSNCQAVVLSQLNLRFYPEFGFTIGPVGVHVHSRLFAREKIETKAAALKNSWAHQKKSYHLQLPEQKSEQKEAQQEEVQKALSQLHSGKIPSKVLDRWTARRMRFLRSKVNARGALL